MAIVAERERGRVYIAPTQEQENIVGEAAVTWKPAAVMPDNPRWFSPPLYGLTTFGDLFTPRQLGGAAAYERIRADDERATNPGDLLRELLREYGPCLILVDEWVAYARQLHDSGDLPAGSFETQFSFAQTLTESAKGVENSLLVVSLPASDTGAPRREAMSRHVLSAFMVRCGSTPERWRWMRGVSPRR